MTSWPIGFLDDVLDELVDDFEIHIRFEQGRADVLHGLADVFLADPAAAGKGAEHAAEFVGECVEHGLSI